MSRQQQSAVLTPQIKSHSNDVNTPSQMHVAANNVQQKRRTRSMRRLVGDHESNPKQIIRIFFQGKQSAPPNTIGKVLMHHQRVAQELRYDPGSKVLKQRLKQIQTTIRNMKKRNPSSTEITAKQVYDCLEQKFATCPWPIPPSAILMALPIEEIAGKKTREQVLRRIIHLDRTRRLSSKWEFRDVSPYPKTL